jgi:hypothetical protein
MYTTHVGEQFTLYALKYEVAVALQKILFIYAMFYRFHICVLHLPGGGMLGGRLLRP